MSLPICDSLLAEGGKVSKDSETARINVKRQRSSDSEQLLGGQINPNIHISSLPS